MNRNNFMKIIVTNLLSILRDAFFSVCKPLWQGEYCLHVIALPIPLYYTHKLA